MKSKSKQIIITILLGFALFFTNYNYVLAEEDNLNEEEITTIEEDNKDEVVAPKEEHWTDDITYDKVKDYKIDFDKIFRTIDKELSKLKNVTFDRLFGNYNSFYEAVNMSKESIVKVLILIVIISIVLYIIMKIFKIGKK